MKPQLLILHGALGAKKQFDELATFLSNHFHIFCLDFDGHGTLNGHSSDFSIDHFADQLSIFMKENNLNQSFVFGYSMGGYVALKLESENPGTFSSILTLGTKFNWTPESAAQEVKMLNPEKIEEKVPAFAAYLKSLHGESWKELMNKTGKMMLEMGENPPLEAHDLGKISATTKCMRGSLDVMVSEEETKWAVNALQQSAYLEVVDWPHPIDKIPPVELAKLITAYFLPV